MKEVQVPYGRGSLTFAPDERSLRAVLRPALPKADGQTDAEIVQAALAAPIGSAPLSELARGAKHVTVLTSDHTRPLPSVRTLPPLLAEIRRGNPAAQITILVATGMHRPPTEAEMREKFGALYGRERFILHDARDEQAMIPLGRLPSGCPLAVNRAAVECDLLVAEGFIEPHFFAGFSGGRKSVLPGIASERSVRANHCGALIASPAARAGVLTGNPIHADMTAAARMAGLRFISNVILDGAHRCTAAFAGEPEAAHAAGSAYLKQMSGAPCNLQYDIVITGNGGYPLDQNLYQAVKSLSTAEQFVRPDGVIICASECEDGAGGEQFLRFFEEEPDPSALFARLSRVPADRTAPDQWQSQILARVRSRADIIMITCPSAKRAVLRAGLRWAANPEQALAAAEQLCPGGQIAVIPDGVSVIPLP